jgi:hypothetical protein
MKCSECKNFKTNKIIIEKEAKDKTGGTCVINNKACDPGDECKTGLFDKMSAI